MYFPCHKANLKIYYKTSIRVGSFIENIKLNLVDIYFFLVDCFIFNLSKIKVRIEYKKLNEELNLGNLSNLNI